MTFALLLAEKLSTHVGLGTDDRQLFDSPTNRKELTVKSSIVLLPALCLFVLSTPSHAEQRLPFKPTETELLALPDYCRARLSRNADMQKPWILKMGKENYSHLHHYCSGLIWVNRIGLVSRSKHKKHYIRTGISEFNYVISRWPDSFYLTKQAKEYKSQLEFQLKMK